MILISWMTRFTVLGVKLDACFSCGNICPHVVGRKTRWAGLFYIPLLLLGFEHGMACTSCKAWTGIPFRQVRQAMKVGLLPLDRARTDAESAYAAAAPDEPPLTPLVFDRFTLNRRRGPWDLYLKAWPVLVALAVTAGPIAAAQASSPGGPLHEPAAHTCWANPDGSIAGCRLSDGSVEGVPTNSTLTCFFDEPLPQGDVSLKCR